MKSLITLLLFVLTFLCINLEAFAEEDTRDAESNFFRSSIGLFGHFDRIHVRDYSSSESRINTMLTCFGWGLFYDYGYFFVNAGLRSQLGTSSLDPGYVDDEQLVLTLGIQGKFPFYFGRLLKIYPSIGIEYGKQISGIIRNSESYFPLLVKLGFGSDIEITQDIFLRTVGDISVSPTDLGSISTNKYTTFFSASEMIGMRIR